MNPLLNETGIYTPGGTVQAGTGIYLTRQADDELLSLCRARSFAYVLTARQMGKSSLMVRTSQHLAQEGIKSINIDLTRIGAAKIDVTAEKWFFGILLIIKTRLGLQVNLLKWWHENSHLTMAQRLIDFFEDILLKEIPDPIVIFVDEIDTTLRLSFTDDFYAAIRFLYNERASIPAFKRLSFVLIGVATPNSLIANPDQTPFNIGQRVELSDFTFEEALPLAEGLKVRPTEAKQVLRWMLDWTNGHPYLTQRLCLAISEQSRNSWSQADVDELVRSTFFNQKSEQDNNLQFVRDMLIDRIPMPLDPIDVLLAYRNIRQKPRQAVDEERSLVKSHLKLSGIVRANNGLLRIRNPIYDVVFDDQWIREHLPPTWTKRQLDRTRKAAIGLAIVLLVVMGLTAFAANRAIVANRQTKIAEEQTRLAEGLRQEAEHQKEVAEKQRARAEHAQQEAEASAAEALAQRKVAFTQRKIAENNLIKVKEQTAKTSALATREGLFRQGSAALMRSEYEAAREKFKPALIMYHDAGDRSAEAITLIGIASSFASTNSAEALKLYGEARNIYQASPRDESGLASVNLDMAKLYRTRGEKDKAAGSLETALTIFEKQVNLSKQAETLESLSSLYLLQNPNFPTLPDDENSGDDEAISQSPTASREKPEEIKKGVDYLSRALAIYEKLPARSYDKETRILRTLAFYYMQVSEKHQAVTYLNKLLSVYQQQNKSEVHHEIYLALAKLYDDPGERGSIKSFYESIESVYQPLLQKYREAGDKEAEAGMLFKIASLYGTKDEERSLKYFAQALEAYQQLQNHNGQIAVLLGIGDVYRNTKKPLVSLDSYLRAVDLAFALPYYVLGLEEGPIRSGFPLGSHVLKSMKRLYKDETFKRQIDAKYSQTLFSHPTGDTSGIAYNTWVLGLIHYASEEKDVAAKYYNELLSSYKKAGDFSAQAKILMELGSIELAIVGPERGAILTKASDYFRQAIELYQQAKDRSGEAQGLACLGLVAYRSSVGENDNRAVIFAYFNQAFTIFSEIKDQYGEAFASYSMAYFTDPSQTQEAINRLLHSLSVSEQLGWRSLQETVLNRLRQAYEKAGDKGKAEEYRKKIDDLQSTKKRPQPNP